MRNVQLLSSGLRWSSTATSLSAKSFEEYERFMQELMKVMTEGRSEGAKLFFVSVLVHGRRRMVTESDVDGDYDEVQFFVFTVVCFTWQSPKICHTNVLWMPPEKHKKHAHARTMRTCKVAH